MKKYLELAVYLIELKRLSQAFHARPSEVLLDVVRTGVEDLQRIEPFHQQACCYDEALLDREHHLYDPGWT